jgi:ABC-type polysaccharide/polyol phosphate export permease
VTIFVVLLENVYDTDQIVLLAVSIAYLVYGFIVAVMLYGRKTFVDARAMIQQESIV